MAIASDTPVPTPDGWRLAANLKPGDVLFDPRGGIKTVASVQSYIPGHCYRIEMDDGTSLVGDRHAAMVLQDKKWRCNQQAWFRNQGNKFAQSRFRRPLKRKTFAELYKGPILDKFGRRMWSLQTVSPLEYPSVNLPVPPYVLGLWLGSVTGTGRHWLGDKDFNLMQRRVREVGFTLVRKKKGDWMFSFRPSVRESFTFAGAVIPDVIPQSYLESDVESRKMLLQGLLDAQDAKKVKKPSNGYSICDSWGSIRRKQQLLEGLGYVTRLHKIAGKTNYSLIFTKMSENAAMHRRFVTNVEKITPRQCVHVVVEGEFVAGEGFLAVC